MTESSSLRLYHIGRRSVATYNIHEQSPTKYTIKLLIDNKDYKSILPIGSWQLNC